MPMPSKNLKPKYYINLDPPKPGTEYLKYGFDRIEELMRQADPNIKYFPRTILLEDLDAGIFDFINLENIKLIIEGNLVKTFYLENDRWGELSKTWKFTDNDNNIPTPYITIRRIEKGPGTRLGTLYRIPQPKKFVYFQVPILDNGEVIFLHFKIPEPVNVDLTYEANLFTKYRVDVNQYDEIILKAFASRQAYTTVKGLPFPITLEGMTEANTMENIDGDRFYMSKYTFKLYGQIQDEDEFKIVKTTRKTNISTTLF
jgi:hypothetical protein